MEIGSVVNGQYTVIEHVGRGGMADVWSARDQRLRRMVAIKTIARNLSPDIDPVALFEREARTIAQMEHPHILPIYDFGEFEGSLYIVMRYMTGGSLEDILARGPMPYGEVLQMGQAIAQAMDYAHTNNVIHLDLKPPNILLDSQQMPYLADFGLATALDPEGRARNPGSGTLLYMAPEQLTSETIDHRADIYSFTIMLFHMLTGQLPFDGTAPLAVRQIQYHDELPEIEEFVPDLPSAITDVLRSGTMQDPSRRPRTLTNVMEQLREALLSSGDDLILEGIPSAENLFQLELPSYDPADSELLEAVDIYSRARHAWAGGQGRFLVSMTHYLLMVQYYMDADFHDLMVDQAGLEMLLRGAMEYDYEVEYWWNLANDASRRLVCLHTIRSGTTPARIRAFVRLETLSDDHLNPTIPRLVSQALSVERDPYARIAALRLLGTRARLIKTNQNFAILTQFRGRMLTTMTRMGLLLTPVAVWRDQVYTAEIDLLIAEQALDTDDEMVSEFAARTVGQMRSLAAVQYLAQEQREGRSGALRALGFVRDEAPSLPEDVSLQARFYAWTTNTVRRLSDRPLDLIARFLLVLIAAWIGMGQQVYNTFTALELFSLQRLTNTLGFGIMFGVMVALVVLFSDEFSRRLRGFWPWWARLLVFGSVGYFMATVAWYLYQLLFLNYDPPVTMAVITGFGLAFGYIVSSLVNLKSWQSIFLATVSSWLPIYAGYASFYENATFNIAWAVPVGVTLGLLIGYWMQSYTFQIEEKPTKSIRVAHTVVYGVVGALFAVATWYLYGLLHYGLQTGSPLTWFGTTALVLIPMFGCMLFSYFMPDRRSFVFGAAFLALFTGMYLQYGRDGAFTDVLLAPNIPDTIIYFDFSGWYGDQTGMIYTVTLPMMFMMALGANFPFLMRGWWRLVGGPSQFHERSAWLGGVLAYTMVGSVVFSVFALFSIQYTPIWAIAWSLWGFASFVAALAAWRWAKWGARATVVLAMLALVGGFLYDLMLTTQALEDGIWPTLFDPTATLIWFVWALWLAAFTWAVFQQKLWGVMGLGIMLLLWVMVAAFVPIQESYTILGATHLALLAYAMRNQWNTFEEGRFHLPEVRQPHLPISQKSSSTAGDTTAIAPSEGYLGVPSTLDESKTDAVPETQRVEPMREDELVARAPQASPSTKQFSDHQPILDYPNDNIGQMATELDLDGERGLAARNIAPKKPIKPDDATEAGRDMVTEYDPAIPRGMVNHSQLEETDSLPPTIEMGDIFSQDEVTNIPTISTEDLELDGTTRNFQNQADTVKQPKRDAHNKETTPSASKSANMDEPTTDFPVISFDIGRGVDIFTDTRLPMPDVIKESDAPTLDIDFSQLETKSPQPPQDRLTEIDARYRPDEEGDDNDDDPADD